MTAADFITVKEAAAQIRACERTVLSCLRRGEFLASLPRGRRGGWLIVRESFERWWSARMGATSNRSAATLSKKQK